MTHAAAVFKLNDGVAQGAHFRALVGDIKDGNVERLAQPQQIGNDPCLQRRVQTGQRFVEQKQLRRGEQCAGKGDALFFAAGKLRHAARNQRRDFQNIRDVLETEKRVNCFAGFAAVKQILPDRQMRKQRQVLRHVTDAARTSRRKNFLRSIGQHAVIELNKSRGRAAQAGDEIEQGRLARARRAENGGDAAVDFKVHCQREVRERQ